VSAVSLNRCEQRIFDYLQAQPEERRHWQRKIQAAAREGLGANAVSRLEGELWRYYVERSAVAALQIRLLGFGNGSVLALECRDADRAS